MRRKRLIIVSLTTLFFFMLISASSRAEFDNTRKMKAEAQHYFDHGEYYKAIDIWAEVLKIDSYDQAALQGIANAQKILEETKSETEKAQQKRLRELIQKGKNYSRDKEYKKALSAWGEALSIDPTNQEALDLIEETRIRAQYQIDILDKLDREKRLKTPHIDDLNRITNKMIDLLEKADVKLKETKRKKLKEEVELETIAKIESETEFITGTFAKGEKFYKAGEFKKAISEWNKILPYLPKSSELALRIAKLKGKIATEEELQRKKEILKRKKEAKEIKRLKKAKRVKPAEVEKIKVPPDEIEKDFLLIAVLVLLIIFLTVKIYIRTKVKPQPGKVPPKKAKKEEEFQPRDLKKFLKKKPENEDKDLFK